MQNALERHQQMANLPRNAEFRIIKGAVHISTLEQPDAVNAVLQGFLRSIGVNTEQ